VTNMSDMFYRAESFNQVLTGWNVSYFDTEPTNFSYLAALTSGNKPVWGTDGT